MALRSVTLGLLLCSLSLLLAACASAGSAATPTSLAAAATPPAATATTPPSPTATTPSSPTATMAPSPTAATVAATPTSPAATAATAGAAATPTEAVQTLTLGSTTYNDHGTIDVTGKDEVTLEADNFYFDPTFLRGTPGQKVTLEIENESRILHNISVDGQSVDMDVQPSGKTTVEVTFPPSGVVRFYCKYHATQGMNGEMLAGQATPQPAQ